MIAELKERLWYWAVRKLLGKRSVVYNCYIRDGVVTATHVIDSWIDGSTEPLFWWSCVDSCLVLNVEGPFIPMLPLL